MARLLSGLCLITLFFLPILSCGHHSRDVPVAEGCFASSQPLISQGYYKYQSSGYCNIICTRGRFPVFALSNGTLCFCGKQLPPSGTQVAASRCSTPCQGYSVESCGGGTNYFTVWLTGVRENISHYTLDNSNTSTPLHSRELTATRTGEPPTHETAPATAATRSGSNSASASGSETTRGSDQKLVIGLSVGLGFPTIVSVGFILWCLVQRRKPARRPGRDLNDFDGTTFDSAEGARQGTQGTGGPTTLVMEGSQSIDEPPSTNSTIPQTRIQEQDFDFGFHLRDDGEENHASWAGNHGNRQNFMYINDIGESDSTEIVYSSNSASDSQTGAW